VGPMAGLEGAEISPPTGIRSPYRPGRSKSLYGLRYASHKARYFIRKPARPFDKVCMQVTRCVCNKGRLEAKTEEF